MSTCTLKWPPYPIILYIDSPRERRKHLDSRRLFFVFCSVAGRSNTNNVGVEVCVPTPMVFGFFFPPDLPPILETPLVFQRHVSVATLSGRGDIKLKALWSRYGKSTRPEKRNGGKEIRPLDFCWWLKMVVVVVALGKKLVWIHSLQHLQPWGMDRWKLVVFLYKAFFLAVSLFVSIHRYAVHLSNVFHN